jgi:cytochrome oxidase Cu insertion factor (SCO1/SenC/PrrC family)
MAKRCKGLNSKCFLISYLMIVGFLLVLWMNRLPLMNEDQRDIPADMQTYIASPARQLPEFSLNTPNKLALTNHWFEGKWSFVYFSNSHCLPACQPALAEMNKLKASFANADFQFLVIGVDTEHETADQLATFLQGQQLDFNTATASASIIEELARSFIALFLQTDYADGSYQIEQEHHLFVVDPKGRVYATFKPPFNHARIQAEFLKLRYFYAKSEGISDK